MGVSNQFIVDRLLFAGLPFGDLRRSTEVAASRGEWGSTFCNLADCYADKAKTAANRGWLASAHTYWRWSAIALQGASFELHLFPERHREYIVTERIRRGARAAYRNALMYAAPDRISRQPVSIDAMGEQVEGYFDQPTGPVRGFVILVNGLDSIAEVELRAFGTWFLERGNAILSLNIPINYAEETRRPSVDVRHLVPSICDWIDLNGGVERQKYGIFGVSFGGHLVAQFLASDPRIVCGAAVCPPAYIGAEELATERIRIMWACALARSFHGLECSDNSLVDIRKFAPPAGQLLLYGCHADPVFGYKHLDAYREWAGANVEVRMMAAEHVGTSRFSDWIPEVSDWMCDQITAGDS
jgi:dienelactone hydrolase